MATPVSHPAYPVRVDASLQPGLSRWLWLVKWLLAIPHFVILALLWVAFVVLSLVALVSILFTGRYPRAIFDFNVGVLRWHWRVAYYSYGAFGTDRYPPFTLAEVPDYPAHLEVAYPQHLSRGLALVKWWLLALPHYLVVGLFVGGGATVAWQLGDVTFEGARGGGLVTLLALIAAVVLAVTGRYPRSLFDFILGMDRWVLRVAAYAALMTDRYPPFRLDMGGPDPAGTLTLPRPGGTAEPEPPAAAPPDRGGWTTGRVVAVVTGTILALASVGALGGGGALLWADQTQRDDGYLTSPSITVHSDGYAVASDAIARWTRGDDWYRSSPIGDIRIRVTAADSSGPVFVGIAPASEAAGYLAGVRHTTVVDLAGSRDAHVEHSGGAPATPPRLAGIWVAQQSGTGTQSLVWPARDGHWVVVAMNADAAPNISVETDVGAAVPALTGLAIGLLTGGTLFLIAAVLLVALPIRRASR